MEILVQFQQKHMKKISDIVVCEFVILNPAKGLIKLEDVSIIGYAKISDKTNYPVFFTSILIKCATKHNLDL